MSDINDMEKLGTRWYVAHTYSGYEHKVKTSLEKIVENRGLGNLIFDIQIPTETIVTIEPPKKEGDEPKEKVSEHRIFPCYVYVKMIMNDDSWHAVRNITGVTGFVGPGSKPTPLSEREVAELNIEQVTTVQLSFKEGDTVDVVSGMFEGYSGVVQSISEDLKNVTVLVKRGRRDMSVEISADELRLSAQ